MPSRLTRAHIEAERRLQERAAASVKVAWDSLGSWNEADVPRFVARATAVVEAAQRQSVALTDAYVARSLDRQPIGVSFDELAKAFRNGTPLEEVYARPFVNLWTALGESRPFQDGYDAALARAMGSAAMDVQLAMRETANAIDRADSTFNGYRRVANAGACAFCQEVDGAWVSYEDVMALHDHCNCGVEPNTDDDLPPLQSDATGTAVNEHGELGPMLGDPSHEFTAL